MAPNAQNVIVIDQLADAILMLKNPNAAFAVWREQDDAVTLPASSGKETETISGEKPLESGSTRQDSGTSSSPNEENGPSQTDSDEGNEVDASISYWVSSRHLISGSAKFRSELTGPWDESTRGEDGLYHLSTSDWDSEAFEILLNVLHLRNRQVPKQLSLELLAKVAVLINYYRCWEAFDLFSTLWLAKVRVSQPVPQQYERDLMLWMVIGWVFKLPEEFTLCTGLALRQNKEPHVQDMELGIPPVILCKASREKDMLQC
jgi:hypothetical protein